MRTYTYDANGNTLTAGEKTYTYNDRGQQTGYSNGTTAAAYAYNPSGLRNVKTVGGSTKYFVYNGMNIVYAYSEGVADVTLAPKSANQNSTKEPCASAVLLHSADCSLQFREERV